MYANEADWHERIELREGLERMELGQIRFINRRKVGKLFMSFITELHRREWK